MPLVPATTPSSPAAEIDAALKFGFSEAGNMARFLQLNFHLNILIQALKQAFIRQNVKAANALLMPFAFLDVSVLENIRIPLSVGLLTIEVSLLDYAVAVANPELLEAALAFRMSTHRDDDDIPAVIWIGYSKNASVDNIKKVIEILNKLEADFDVEIYLQPNTNPMGGKHRTTPFMFALQRGNLNAATALVEFSEQSRVIVAGNEWAVINIALMHKVFGKYDTELFPSNLHDLHDQACELVVRAALVEREELDTIDNLILPIEYMLHFAVHYGYLETVKTIVANDNFLDVTLRSGSQFHDRIFQEHALTAGDTSLHIVLRRMMNSQKVTRTDCDIAQALLVRGARIDIPNRDGHFAYQMIRKLAPFIQGEMFKEVMNVLLLRHKLEKEQYRALMKPTFTAQGAFARNVLFQQLLQIKDGQLITNCYPVFNWTYKISNTIDKMPPVLCVAPLITTMRQPAIRPFLNACLSYDKIEFVNTARYVVVKFMLQNKTRDIEYNHVLNILSYLNYFPTTGIRDDKQKANFSKYMFGLFEWEIKALAQKLRYQKSGELKHAPALTAAAPAPVSLGGGLSLTLMVPPVPAAAAREEKKAVPAVRNTTAPASGSEPSQKKRRV